MGLKVIFLMAFLCLASNFLFAQNNEKFVKKVEIQLPDSGYVQILKTSDGSKLVGKVVSFNEEKVFFETQNGTFELKRESIKSLEYFSVSNIRKGEFFLPDPNTTRLFFSPKGKMLKQKKGYYQNTWLFFHNVNFGVTDNVTMGIGAFLFPGMEDQLFYFTPKIGKKIDKRLSIAGGILGIKLPDTDKLIGIGYGVGTIEIKKDVVDFTFGAGYGFAGSDLAEKPVLMLGLETRVGSHFAFISENWIVPGFDRPINSLGLRFFGEKLAVDLAYVFMIPVSEFIPYLDFVYNF